MACTLAQAVADHFAFEQMARVEAQAEAAHLAVKLGDTAAALQARDATADHLLICCHAAYCLARMMDQLLPESIKVQLAYCQPMQPPSSFGSHEGSCRTASMTLLI